MTNFLSRLRRAACAALWAAGLWALAHSGSAQAQDAAMGPAGAEPSSVGAPAGDTAGSGGGFPWPTTDLVSLPPSIGGKPVLVLVDFFVSGVPDILLPEQQFTAIVSEVVQWNDPRLSYDADTVGRHAIEYTGATALEVLRTIWAPSVTVINRYHTGTPLQADVLLTIYASGLVTLETESSVSASYSADLRKFPFDRQTLTLQLSTFGRLLDDIQLDLLSVGVLGDPATLVPSNYRFVEITSDERSDRAGLPGSPIEYSINIVVDRNGRYYVLRHMMPLFVLAAVSAAVFWMTDSKLHDRIKITSISMLTIVTFMLFLNRDLPRVPYPTTLGIFYVAMFCFPMLAAIQSVIVIELIKKGKHRVAERLDRIGRRSFLPLLVSFFLIPLLVRLHFF